MAFLLILHSLLFFLFSLLFYDPTVFSSTSSSPLPSSSASWILSFLCLSLLHRPFLSFLLFSFSYLFLSLAFSSSFIPFSFALLLSFLLGCAPLSVFHYSFIHFPLACFCVHAVCGFVFHLYLLLPSFFPFACLCVLAVSFVFRFCFPLLFSLSDCIPPRFIYLLLAVCFCWSLPASPTPPTLPPLGAFAI